MKIIPFAKNLTRLCRLPIAFLTSFSALTGYLLGIDRSLNSALLVTGGVFFLAAGASALNQYQERHIDSFMERTRQRPLPARAVTSGQAFLIAAILIMTGLLLLSFPGNHLPRLLGVFALAWYNGVYTFLKRVTAFAAVPGAVVGMLPPAIGWAAAGSSLSDPRLWALCFFFFMWQVPHFWLQMLDHGAEYEEAGLPTFSTVFAQEQFARTTFIWICATAVSSLLLPLYGTIRSPLVYFLLLPASGIVIVTGSRLLISLTKHRVLSAFRTINVYLLIIMSLLSLESFFLRIP